MLVLALAVVLGACGPAATPTPPRDAAREAILTFTRQALQIEANREDLLNLGQRGYASRFVANFFLRGITDEGLPSAPELKAKMLVLDSPPSLQSVKDLLVEAYRLEIEAAQLEHQRDALKGGATAFDPHVDRLNVDSVKKGEARFLTLIPRTGPWVIAQELRRDAYLKWARVLREHGIDPAKEGFTALVAQ